MVEMAMPTDRERELELVAGAAMKTEARREVVTLMLELVMKGLAVCAVLTVMGVAAQVEEGVGAGPQALMWPPAVERRGQEHRRRAKQRKGTGIV